ncbi:CHAT domain-containing protein [Calothrix sp. UHCC 0171]|uniref:CHAT domain-containing protein n=1 Tax=Calothrix sp. UHCC 0171 TaxID=3110245 RepID=UPI002B1EA6B2|nr:CHAT domain-containing protein [Calothrix sp. UHCC 0171]MEA5574025.1 CHAT domain-containing protein [Calothrix sp. UHCC 0171]
MSIYILSLLICSLGITIDTSYIFRENSLKADNFNTLPLNLEQIKQVVKTQNATIVQYSILYDEIIVNGNKQIQESRLLTWVIKPNSEISMREVNLQARRCKQRFSFIKLIQKQHSCSQAIANPQNVNIQKLHLKELHQILIEPIADLLPDKTQGRVIFIPQGDLFLVPFIALQDNNDKYLIEKYVIHTAPSIQVLDLLYQRQIKRQSGKFSTQKNTNTNIKSDELLIVGNPTAPKLPPKPGEKPLQLLPIPGAEKEAKAIAKIFKTQAITGDAATETTIVKKMPQAKIIHLATHAVELNNSNAIALATSTKDDGWLSVAEIQKLPLKADLVVLSAANTALGRISSDGIIGLSRAFFVAGADSIIGSLWEVGDEATSFLMVKFYENFSKNSDKASAFRKAILETMKKYPNPQDWAGFTSIGLL